MQFDLEMIFYKDQLFDYHIYNTNADYPFVYFQGKNISISQMKWKYKDLARKFNKELKQL